MKSTADGHFLFPIEPIAKLDFCNFTKSNDDKKTGDLASYRRVFFPRRDLAGEVI